MEAIWTLTLTGSLMALLVLLLRALLGRRLPPRLSYALWLPVLLCLLVPLRLPSAVSIRNAAPVQRVDRAVAQIASRPLVLAGWEAAQPQATAAPAEDAAAQEVPAAPPRDAGPDVGMLLTCLWATGAVGTAAGIAHVNLRFAARVRRSRKPVEGLERRVGRGLARRLRGVRVYCSRAVSSPCLMGVFRPCIVLTPAALESEERLTHVLVHELSHRRQGDAVFGLLRSAALVLHWFNPIVWLAAARSREDCESACDALAIRALGEEAREAYGKTLLAFVNPSPTAAGLVNATTAMAQSRGSMKRRIARLARGRRRFAAALSAVAVLAALTGCAVTMTGPGDAPPAQAVPTPTPSAPAASAAPTPRAEADSATPTALPDDRPERVAQAMEDYEAALAGRVPAFSSLSQEETADLLPEMALDFHLYGRRNANGDTYVLALAKAGMEIAPEPVEALVWGIGTVSPGDTMEEYCQLQQYGVRAEDGKTILLREYLLAGAQSVNQLAEDLFLVLITATDPILYDAANPTTLAILRTAEARGMTYGRELDAPYGVVYLMDEQTRSATGIAERLEFRFPLEGAPWAELLARLEAAEVAADAPESVPSVDDCIVTERATYSLCADRLRVRAQDGGSGWILDAELAQAVREAFAQKRGADPLAVSLDWLEGTRLVRAALEFPVLVSGDGTEAYEMRAQTIEEAAALAELQSLLRASEETIASACPFGGKLTLVREDGQERVFYVASDSCAVLTADGGRHFDYGSQEALLDLFPACRGE